MSLSADRTDQGPFERGGTILIVDDEVGSYTEAITFWEQAGFVVASSRNASEGLDTFVGISNRASLVIIDIIMTAGPGQLFDDDQQASMGYYLYLKIRELSKSVPVIIYTHVNVDSKIIHDLNGLRRSLDQRLWIFSKGRIRGGVSYHELGDNALEIITDHPTIGIEAPPERIEVPEPLPGIAGTGSLLPEAQTILDQFSAEITEIKDGTVMIALINEQGDTYMGRLNAEILSEYDLGEGDCFQVVTKEQKFAKGFGYTSEFIIPERDEDIDFEAIKRETRERFKGRGPRINRRS